MILYFLWIKHLFMILMMAMPYLHSLPVLGLIELLESEHRHRSV